MKTTGVQAYALRMDLSKWVDRAKTLAEWLSKCAQAFLVVKEDVAGENLHCHVVFHTEKQLSALRKSIQREFGTAGNGDYSLKKCNDDVDAYMRYMCKGGSKDEPPVVIARQGLEYTDEKIADAHDRYWVNNEALVANKRKRDSLRKMNIVEKLEQLCKEEGVTRSDREGIAKKYIKMCVEARKPINTFAARSIVNTVQILLDDTGSASEELARQIAGM